VRMQRSYSYGYPLSTLSNHVSSSPNHQTLRETSIDTRFNVAMFGVLGYELLFSEISRFEAQRAKNLIEVYKEFRETFQFGEFIELESNFNSLKWQVSNHDKSQIVLLHFNLLQVVLPMEGVLRVVGADENAVYKVDVVTLPHELSEFGGLVNQVTPFHVNPNGLLATVVGHFVKMPGEIDEYIVNGSMINNGAVKLTPEWTGSGFSDKVRALRDFGSRIYLIRKMDETH